MQLLHNEQGTQHNNTILKGSKLGASPWQTDSPAIASYWALIILRNIPEVKIYLPLRSLNQELL